MPADGGAATIPATAPPGAARGRAGDRDPRRGLDDACRSEPMDKWETPGTLVLNFVYVAIFVVLYGLVFLELSGKWGVR